MPMRPALLVLLLPACAGAPLATPASTPAAVVTAPPVRALVWVDATGKQVTQGDDLRYVAEGGLVLYLDPETGQPAHMLEDVHYLSGFLEAGCAGQMVLVAQVQPRVPFSLGDGLGYRVRGDTTASRAEGIASRPAHGGGCMDLDARQAFPVFDMPPPTLKALPVLPFTGPLHLEVRTWPTP